MFTAPPPFRQHWVYDDPSGVPEPSPYARRWHPRVPLRMPHVSIVRNRNRVRVAHREG